jgi:hypothetical protein
MVRHDQGGHGQFQVDPAELFRVYEPAGKERNGEARVEAQSVTRDAPTRDAALQVRCASLEAEVAGLKQMVEELRRSREKWEAQAERLTLALPPPSLPAHEARQAASGGRWQAFWRRAGEEGCGQTRNGCTRPVEPP